MLSALHRYRVLFFTAIGGFATGITFSPTFLDQGTLCAGGFMTAVGACCWLAGESNGQTDRARIEFFYAEQQTRTQHQRDRLVGVLEAARAEVENILADRGDHDACPVRDQLNEVLDDGPLSIGAYNRARAGLMPAARTAEEG